MDLVEKLMVAIMFAMCCFNAWVFWLYPDTSTLTVSVLCWMAPIAFLNTHRKKATGD